jgi:hypothetical protein
METGLGSESESESGLVPGFGFSLEDAAGVLEEARARRRRVEDRDARICVCGHPVRSHTGYPGSQLCKPAKMECPCREAVGVLTAQDTRQFLWATTGAGPRHALFKGVLASIEKGKTWEWIEGAQRCRVCEEETEKVIPAAVTPHGGVVQRPEKMNGLLCPECFRKLGGVLT